MSEGKRVPAIIAHRLIQVPPYEGQAERQRLIEESERTGKSILELEQGRRLTPQEERSLSITAKAHARIRDRY